MQQIVYYTPKRNMLLGHLKKMCWRFSCSSKTSKVCAKYYLGQFNHLIKEITLSSNTKSQDPIRLWVNRYTEREKKVYKWRLLLALFVSWFLHSNSFLWSNSLSTFLSQFSITNNILQKRERNTFMNFIFNAVTRWKHMLWCI